MSIQIKSPQRPAVPAGARTVTAGTAAAVGLSILVFALLYGKVLAALAQQWLPSDVYSYGFLIPFISLYLVWLKRGSLLKETITSSRLLGPAILGAGLSMLIIGHAGRNLILQEVSLPISLAGFLTVLLGRRYLRLLWLPVFYLYFMIPVWSFAIEPLRPVYQNISAALSAILMKTAGVPVYRNGIFLDLPNITLEVAPGCSGIYYLIAIIAIGIPLAYLYLRSWPRRILLVASGIAIATFFNGLRIALIGFMSYHGISATLHGPGHVLQALSVTFVGYMALFAGVWLLREKRPSRQEIISFSGRNDLGQDFSSSKIIGPRFWITTALLATAGLYLQIQTFPPVPLKRSFDSFPDKINKWTKTGEQPLFDGKNYVEADQSLSRTYASPEHGRVSLFVGYFEQQGLRKKLVNYRMAAMTERARTRDVNFGARGIKKVNTLVSSVNGEPALLVFWYDISGRIIADSRRASLRTAVDGLVHGRQNGALVVVSQKITDPEDPEEAAESCAAFIRQVIPAIDGFVP